MQITRSFQIAPACRYSTFQEIKQGNITVLGQMALARRRFHEWVWSMSNVSSQVAILDSHGTSQAANRQIGNLSNE